MGARSYLLVVQVLFSKVQTGGSKEMQIVRASCGQSSYRLRISNAQLMNLTEVLIQAHPSRV